MAAFTQLEAALPNCVLQLHMQLPSCGLHLHRLLPSCVNALGRIHAVGGCVLQLHRCGNAVAARFPTALAHFGPTCLTRTTTARRFRHSANLCNVGWSSGLVPFVTRRLGTRKYYEKDDSRSHVSYCQRYRHLIVATVGTSNGVFVFFANFAKGLGSRRI